MVNSHPVALVRRNVCCLFPIPENGTSLVCLCSCTLTFDAGAYKAVEIGGLT